MALILGHFYKLRIDTGKKIITYHAEILESGDSMFIKFKDKFGKIWEYYKNSVFYFNDITRSEMGGVYDGTD